MVMHDCYTRGGENVHLIRIDWLPKELAANSNAFSICSGTSVSARDFSEGWLDDGQQQSTAAIIDPLAIADRATAAS
jgi:hypothetical protein